MADEPRADNGGAQPAGELIHLPGPSFLPVITAVGITLAVTGVVISIWLVVIGGAITLFALVRWIRETRQEMSELPLEHH